MFVYRLDFILVVNRSYFICLCTRQSLEDIASLLARMFFLFISLDQLVFKQWCAMHEYQLYQLSTCSASNHRRPNSPSSAANDYILDEKAYSRIFILVGINLIRG